MNAIEVLLDACITGTRNGLSQRGVLVFLAVVFIEERCVVAQYLRIGDVGRFDAD